MKIIMFIISLLTLNLSFAQGPYSEIPSNIEQLIKNDYWSTNPTFQVKIKIRKEDSLELQKKLLIDGYAFNIIKEDLIDTITVNYKNTHNNFLTLIKLYKIRNYLLTQTESCPLIQSDKDIAKKILNTPENGILYSTLDETYLKNYHQRIVTYCNKSFNKSIGFYVTSMFNQKYEKYLENSNANFNIPYPKF